MLERLGGLQVSEQNTMRVVLRLGRLTNYSGLLLMFVGGVCCLKLWPWWHLATLVPLGAVLGGLVIFTLRREVVVDRKAGMIEMRQSMLGLQSYSIVPFGHLAAVVLAAKPGASNRQKSDPGYVVFLQRHGGGAIYLDEARRCRSILGLAEAVAEVAEIRFEYDVSARHRYR